MERTRRGGTAREPHFGAQLLERVKWALEDAEKGEREGVAGRPGVATLATSQGD